MMYMRKAAFITAAAFCVLTALPALAEKGGNGRGNALGHSKGGGNAFGHSKGTPGPIAGAGLPVLVAAGGYALYRRRRNKDK